MGCWGTGAADRAASREKRPKRKKERRKPRRWRALSTSQAPLSLSLPRPLAPTGPRARVPLAQGGGFNRKKNTIHEKNGLDRHRRRRRSSRRSSSAACERPPRQKAQPASRQQFSAASSARLQPKNQNQITSAASSRPAAWSPRTGRGCSLGGGPRSSRFFRPAPSAPRARCTRGWPPPS